MVEFLLKISQKVFKPVLLLLIPFLLVKTYFDHDYTDFRVYYRTALRALEGDWAGLYNLSDGFSPFRYSPFTLLLLIPFGLVREDFARTLWAASEILFFALGYFVIYCTLLKSRYREKAVSIINLAVLLTLRFHIDAIHSGQVTGLFFLFFSLALWFTVHRNNFLAALSIGVPAVFKIGPALLWGVSFPRNLKSLLWIAVAGLPLCWLLGPFFQKWFFVVLSDGKYFDSRHYANQSFYGFYLQYFTRESADRMWLGSVILTVIGCCGTWFFIRGFSVRLVGLKFSLGVIAYLLCMPQTFKHAMPLVAIPFVFLLLRPLRKTGRIWLFSVLLFLTLPGKDVVGDRLFFGIQHSGLPFLVLLFTTILLILEIHEESFESLKVRNNPLKGHLQEKEITKWTADDWGFSPQINGGILELAKLGLVGRVSLMPERAFFNDRLVELKAIQGLEFGLHLDLTENSRFRGPLQLILTWMMSSLNKKRRAELVGWILQKLKGQIQSVEFAQIELSYLDGHHHMHLLPGLMKNWVPLLKEQSIRFVRLPLDPTLLLTMKFPVYLMAILSKASFKKHKLKSLPFVYPLVSEFKNKSLLAERLENCMGYEVICHPNVPIENGTALDEERALEFKVIQSV